MKIKTLVLSGIDGCGKSTQIEYLSKYLNSKEIKYKTIWARPGSTKLMLILKNLARFFFKSLPSPGRSEKRENLMKKSTLGKAWFLLSFIELIYIYKIKTKILNFCGYKVIFDRHIFDSIIDYQIMLERNLLDKNFIKYLLKPNRNTLFINLNISIDESILRCKNKWEPFPDTNNEKIIRYELYQKYISCLNYITIDGTLNPKLIHKDIVNMLEV